VNHVRNPLTQFGNLPRKLWARGAEKNGISTPDPKNGHAYKIALSSPDTDRIFARPRVRGKFLFLGEEKFWVRGVTYGTFRPDENGANYPPPDVVARDLAKIHNAGLNTVRLYTAPPRWLLDLAAAQRLRLMIGLPWEQHIAFLDDKARKRDIIARVRSYVRQCAGHPAVLCYTIGNEIPASIVRWYGKRRIQNFLAELCRVVRQEDPGALLTYVNYPTTEYLELAFVDFIAFNVYLESREQLAAYLARLQNLAGDRPLILAEIGLDSRQNGEEEQAATLEWQIETIFARGCAGAFVFAWTDEWHRGGCDIADWDFGLTTRERKAKPALGCVAKAFQNIPFGRDQHWPRISVAVCSYNGEQTIDETLTALSRLNYPDYEVIVVDDGSTDSTAAIARRHKVSLIQTENEGLSKARNLAMKAATGEIIAYIDDDAYPDADWLKFLAASFTRTNHVGIGGPNLAPPGDGMIADSVAYAPGGPVHVLLTDEIAEHIPGCNMAYRLDRLRAVGGFDPQLKIAGDDVDICWRLQEHGWTLGFSPAAVVWHHRRRSIGTYWKQQRDYARAEALLAEKWPQKYNCAGHVTWSGRLYGSGLAKLFWIGSRIYHGSWGMAPFQSIYEPTPDGLIALPSMPEWYFVIILFGFLALLGFSWPPLLLLFPILAAAVTLSFVQAAASAATPQFPSYPPLRKFAARALVALLHVLQPLARLWGRVRHGLGPWRPIDFSFARVPAVQQWTIWNEKWQSCEAQLTTIESNLLHAGAVIRKGGDFDRWDLSVSGGLFGSVRTLVMVEEHGGGRQLFRLRAWRKVSTLALWSLLVTCVLAVLAGFDRAWLAATSLGLAALGIITLIQIDFGRANKFWAGAIGQLAQPKE
jgi:GT2 family glycosyltransferase